MKRFPIIFLFLSGSLMSMTFSDEILQKLGVTRSEANEAIRNNFIVGELWIPDNQAIKSIVITERAMTVKDLGGYIRKYVESAEFNHAYQQARQAVKPVRKRDVKILITERITAIQDQLNEINEKIRAAGSTSRKLYELSVAQLKQEQEALKNYEHPMHREYVENLAEEIEDVTARTETERSDYTKDFPPTVKELVKLRLKQFLEITENIDFKAELIKRGQYKVFADPALESKDRIWKKLFRAGPQTIGSAREFAQYWLADLEK